MIVRVSVFVVRVSVSVVRVSVFVVRVSAFVARVSVFVVRVSVSVVRVSVFVVRVSVFVARVSVSFDLLLLDFASALHLRNVAHALIQIRVNAQKRMLVPMRSRFFTFFRFLRTATAVTVIDRVHDIIEPVHEYQTDEKAHGRPTPAALVVPIAHLCERIHRLRAEYLNERYINHHPRATTERAR